MKKKLVYLFLMLLCFVPSIARAEEKIKVYIFRGEGCPHCEEALEFFDGLSEEETAKFDLIQYEVWNDESNSKLMKKVASKLGDDVSGVPYIVVGEKSFSGFDDETGESILSQIDEMYENQDLTDVMENLDTSDTNNVSILIGAVIIIGIIVFALTKARKEM
jgi:glutaredoxin